MKPPAAGGYVWESGAKQPAAGRIFISFWKKSGSFNAIWITFRTFSEPFERTKFSRFKSQLNKSLPLLQVKSKTHLKSCILGLNLVTWPCQGNQGTLLSATFLALNHSFEDLPLKIFFVMKITSFRNMYDQKPRTLDSASIICSISISPVAKFF